MPLGALSAHQYTHLTHREFPQHSIVPWGMPSDVVHTHAYRRDCRAYTGYIDAGARHPFFYFFESQRESRADDVVLWINGGPGASSALGLFMGLGEYFAVLRPESAMLIVFSSRSMQGHRRERDGAVPALVD